MRQIISERTLACSPEISILLFSPQRGKKDGVSWLYLKELSFWFNCVLRFLPLPEGALCLVAAAAFSAEYLLFYFHSTTHKGLEGHYHLLLVLLIGLCVLSVAAGALLRTSFPVDLSSGIAITLQGLWFYQTAFTLYGPMMPNGCQLKGDQIVCRSSDSLVRGELLANFQLFSLVFGVLVTVAASYGFAASRYGHSDLKSLHVLPDGLEWDQNRVCDLTLFPPHFVFISDSFSLPDEEMDVLWIWKHTILISMIIFLKTLNSTRCFNFY